MSNFEEAARAAAEGAPELTILELLSYFGSNGDISKILNVDECNVCVIRSKNRTTKLNLIKLADAAPEILEKRLFEYGQLLKFLDYVNGELRPKVIHKTKKRNKSLAI